MDKMRELCDYTTITMVNDMNNETDEESTLFMTFKKGMFTFQGMPDSIYNIDITTFKFDVEKAKVLRDFLNTAIVLSENHMMEEDDF